MTGAAYKIGDSDMKSALSKGGMTTINAEYHISHLIEHYRKVFRIMQLSDFAEGHDIKVFNQRTCVQ